jgi:hypothetical protein
MKKILIACLAAFATFASFLVPARAADPIVLDGTGQVMAIIDVGFDTSLPSIKNRVLAEACFAVYASCPDGTDQMIGSGAATLTPDFALLNKQTHGTEMASVALQVAPNTKLVLVRDMGFKPNGTVYMGLQQLRSGLQWIRDNAVKYGITSVSVSQGARLVSCTPTNNTSEQLAISDLKKMGIPVFLPAGNNGQVGRIDFPACTPDAISIGGLEKRPDSMSAPFEAGLPWAQSNYSSEIDFWSLARWKTQRPGGATTITIGTSNSTAAFNGYWSILRQAKPTATYQEIFDSITSTATEFSTPVVPSGKAINLKAAAELLAGSPVAFIDATPTGASTGTEVIVDPNIDPATLPKPIISNSSPKSPYLLERNTYYPEGYMQMRLNITDTIGVTSLKVYLVDPTGKETLVENAIIPSNPRAFSYDQYLNIPANAAPGSKWSFVIRATNVNGMTERNLGTFTVLAVPEDKTRPTFDFNSTYQSRANTNLQKPGVAVPIYLNARDDVKLVSASYTVTAPDGSSKTYPMTWSAGPLITTRGYNSSWIVPSNAVPGSKYLITANVSDGVGKSNDQVFATVTVYSAPVSTPKPTPSPTASASATPTPTPSTTPVPSSTATSSTPRPQTINFPAIATREYGPAYKLNATSSSGLPITYSSLTPDTCTIMNSNGSPFVQAVDPKNIVTSINCSVRASQPGDSNYSAATNVDRTFMWKAVRTIINASGAVSLIGRGPHSFTAKYTAVDSAVRGGLSGWGPAVTVNSLTPNVCSVKSVIFEDSASKLYSTITIEGKANGGCSLTLSAPATPTRLATSVNITRIISGIK